LGILRLIDTVVSLAYFSLNDADLDLRSCFIMLALNLRKVVHHVDQLSAHLLLNINLCY